MTKENKIFPDDIRVTINGQRYAMHFCPSTADARAYAQTQFAKGYNIIRSHATVYVQIDEEEDKNTTGSTP
jgi:hypothetical protein